MRYRIVEGKHPRSASYGKYVARAVHDNRVTSDEIEREIEANCCATCADVKAVMYELYDVLLSHLRNGDIVELPALGTMKLEIKSKVVDRPEDFRPSEHISAVNLRIIPTSKDGKPEMYSGLEFKKVK